MQYAGTVNDFGDAVFLLVGHEVHAAHAGQGMNFLDQIDAKLAPFASAVLSAGHAFDDDVRDVNAGDMSAHVLGGLGRAQRAHSHENEDFA
jgi:hypothetical protein